MNARPSGLRYNSLSLVFLQIFSVEEFDCERLPKSRFTPDAESIDRQIFHSDSSPCELVRRYKICPSFDFKLRIREDENKGQGHDDDPVSISGRIHVEMSVFLNRTVSLSYRMMVDGEVCRASRPLDTDEVICLAAQSMGTEHWNTRKGVDNDGREFSDSKIDADLVEFTIERLHFGPDGLYVERGEKISGRKEAFAEVLRRYKALVLSCQPPQPGGHCPGTETSYVYLDVWEDVSHSEGLFEKRKFSDSDIIGHIEAKHRRELSGLMSFYPYEWPHRTEEGFEPVCGSNIAIDDDDLVLVNQNICVVFGTYQNREDWKQNVEQRKGWHVSWPEYMMLLEMVLVRKHTLGVIADRYLESAQKIGLLKSTRAGIERNTVELLNATSRIAGLDAIKYSRYISHKIMYERTVARLDVEAESERVRGIVERIDSCLRSLSEMRSLGQSKIINVILGVVSIAALFEILFQQAELPVLYKWGGHALWGHVLIIITAFVVVCAPIMLLRINFRYNRIKK